MNEELIVSVQEHARGVHAGALALAEKTADLATLALALDDFLSAVPWDRDITAELARNPGPYSNGYLQRDGGWWHRELNQIDGLTFHHTLSDSPHATARHYIGQSGGRPTIPYTIWITQTGEVLLCVPLEEGLWHDHTGHENTHLSVGLAGRLHDYRPADVQLDAAAGVALWALTSTELSSLNDTSQIKGHQDYISTICPGWSAAASGRWKDDLYRRISRG